MQLTWKKGALITVAVLLVLALIFVGSMAWDLRHVFRNRDDDYEFADGPGGDISPPPPDNYRDSVVWDDDDDDENGNGNGDDNGNGEYGDWITYTIDPDRVNILLIGVDSAPGRNRAPLSDTIMVFSFHKDGGDPVLMSIPRDTFVYIPGRYMDKINHSHGFGGAALLRQTVEGFTGIPIDYYLRVNMAGFEAIVDLLGGVEMYVERNIGNIRQGTHVLNGEQALRVVRDRNEPRGDFGRVERQQRILVAMAKQVQRSAIHRLPALVREGVKYVDTDMSLLTLLDFANEFNKHDPDSIKRFVVSGRGFNYNRRYYLDPNIDRMVEFITENMTVD